MLLSFHAKNYRSFRDSLDFSMTPAAKQKGLDYSILSEKIGTRDCKALSSAVIYGPNASGKTNIIGAMDTMRSIVLRGNIAKFSQNEELKNFILNTGEKVLVEASPYDDIWGVKRKMDDPDIMDPNKWAGENLLGFVLMETRDILTGK